MRPAHPDAVRTAAAIVGHISDLRRQGVLPPPRSVDIAEIQSQRGQALRIPHREVQVLRGLGEAKGPVTPQLPQDAPSGKFVPWWVWALLGAGALALLVRKDS